MFFKKILNWATNDDPPTKKKNGVVEIGKKSTN